MSHNRRLPSGIVRPQQQYSMSLLDGKPPDNNKLEYLRKFEVRVREQRLKMRTKQKTKGRKRTTVEEFYNPETEKRTEQPSVMCTSNPEQPSLPEDTTRQRVVPEDTTRQRVVPDDAVDGSKPWWLTDCHYTGRWSTG